MTESQIQSAIYRNNWNAEHQAIVNKLLSKQCIDNKYYSLCEELDYARNHIIDLKKMAVNAQEEIACSVFEMWVKQHPGFDMAAGVYGGAYMGKNSKGWKSTQTIGEMLAANRITTASGGGPGAMEVIRVSQNCGLEGISIMQEGLESEQKSKQIHDVDITISLRKLRRRQGLLVDVSGANIIVEGGKGTDYERDEIATLKKTGLCEDDKKTFLVDGAGESEHWHYLHDHNLMLVEKGYLRFSSKNSFNLFKKFVGDKHISFLENYIADLTGTNLTPENIREIAFNCGTNAEALHNVLIDSLYLRFKHGQEHKIVEAIVADLKRKRDNPKIVKNPMP